MTLPKMIVLKQELAVCRLAPASRIPDWGWEGELCSATRTTEECSVITAWGAVPEGVEKAGPWRALMVEGPLDFALVGIVAGISAVLAEADISLFVLSTFDTDYILVRSASLALAVSALTAGGYPIVGFNETE